MNFIADLHIHSHFSLATAKELTPEFLDYWARMKGIKVIGTGDFSHPGWVAELKEKLEPAEQGLYKLKENLRKELPVKVPNTDPDVRFMLTAEISNIYKKKGKVRKVHNLLFAPDFETADKFQEALVKRNFNITSDGRPILGMDSCDLLDLALNVNPNIFFVPAHIWTPWFSALGNKSGFDSIEECYGDLTAHIYAVEMGLSSNPLMNRLCSFLDKFTLIANSDAHSPEKLGRNANIFNTDISYNAITHALKTRDSDKFRGTISFFPQEGKYHYDGHRKCGVCWSPLETIKNNEICTVCGKKVTVGVMNRVASLSDRSDINDRLLIGMHKEEREREVGERASGRVGEWESGRVGDGMSDRMDHSPLRPLAVSPFQIKMPQSTQSNTGFKNAIPFHSLIPLKEILSEITGKGEGSKEVSKTYFSLLQKLGTEFDILLNLPCSELRSAGNEMLVEGIRRMREGEVYIREGYDGEYGIIKVAAPNNTLIQDSQEALFQCQNDTAWQQKQKRPLINFGLAEFLVLKNSSRANKDENEEKAFGNTLSDDKLNAEQWKAVRHFTGPLVVIAGPGTGKTRVLAYRVAHLVQNHEVEPENILAVTFTNKAAGEIRQRIASLLPGAKNANGVTVSTFHALGLSILKEHYLKVGRDKNFIILDDDDKEQLLLQYDICKKSQAAKIIKEISLAKQNLTAAEEIPANDPDLHFAKYENALRSENAFDLDDLLCTPLKILSNDPGVLDLYRQKFKFILVDEYQDTNYVQYQLVRLLMPDAGSNLCVIGDPNQAIYGFRNADVKYIRHFSDDYPGAAIYSLVKSYRCPDRILRASEEVILDKKIEAGTIKGLKKGVKIKIARHPTDRSEAEFIARTIEKMIGGLRFFSMDSKVAEGNEDMEIKSLSDFAVLCRTRGQFKAIEKAMNDHSIPYQAIGETSLFRREPVKTIIDILKLWLNPGNRFLEKKLSAKKMAGVIDEPDFKKQFGNKTVKEIIEVIIASIIEDKDGESQVAIKKLISLATDFGNDLAGFLEFAMLGTDVDTFKPGENVTIMTLHASKGLEFNCVFIAGCEDGLLPYSLYDSLLADTDEEKRLLYVGMTRAEKYLFLTHADHRMIRGREFNLPRSPFIDSIEKELLEQSVSAYKKNVKKPDGQMSLF